MRVVSLGASDNRGALGWHGKLRSLGVLGRLRGLMGLFAP